MPTGSFEAFDVAVRRRRHGPSASVIDLLAGLRRMERIAHLRGDARGIFLDGDHVLARDDVRRAYVLPRDGAPFVAVFETSAQTLEVYVSDATKGEALLEATRLTVKHATVRFDDVEIIDGHRSAFSVPFGVLAVCGAGAAWLNSRGVSPWLLLPISIGFGVIAMLDGTRANEVVIGADGISYRASGRERFLAHRNLSIEPNDDPHGRRAALRIGDERLLFQFGSARAQKSFTSRLEAAIENARRSQLTNDAATRLARGTRAGDEWLRELRALGRSAPESYRAPTIPADDLWQVVEDPAAPSSARAGAALGLHAMLDEPGRVRLRVAAEACASARLRVTLEAAASTDDEEAIERAVERCADDVAAEA